MKNDTPSTVAALSAPSDAVEVDWSHFGEPQTSLARTDGLAVERRLKQGALASAEVQTHLFRWTARGGEAELAAHYRAQPGWISEGSWTVLPSGTRWTVLRRGSANESSRTAVLWVPAQPPSRDALLMHIELKPPR